MRARVLIAHPEAAERARLASVVRAAGLDAIEAADGETALAQSGDAVLALLAPRLLRGDGLAVAGRLRQSAKGAGPAIVLLNDVYPAAQASDKFLREFGLSDALAWPSSPRDLSELLGRYRKLPKRSPRESSKSTDLARTPMALLLGRLATRSETAFVYAHCGDEAAFIVLVKGGVAQIRSNHPAPPAEEDLLRSALAWTSGEAVVVRDPGLEETSVAKLDLVGYIDELVSPPIPDDLLAAVHRLGDRAGSLVFEPARDDREHIEAVGLTAFDRQILELCDGDRSLTRAKALAIAGGVPFDRVLLRLEATGVLRQRPPGTTRATTPRKAPAHAPLLPPRSATLGDGGLLEAGDLARLLVRLEMRRESCTLALRRERRTLEITLANGRVIGVHAWGEGVTDEDPAVRIAATGELRPEDVPLLRRLHAQHVLLDTLRVTGTQEWAMRKSDRASADGLGLAPGALAVELMRDGDLSYPEGRISAGAELKAIAAALCLTTREAKLAASATADTRRSPWLRSLGHLMDTAGRVGRPVADRHRALAGEVARDRADGAPSSLDAMFERAFDEGLREGEARGAPRVSLEPEPVDAIDVRLGGERGSTSSFTLEQGAGGVMIRVGDRAYGIDALIAEVEELRVEKNRLRAELRRRHDLLEERTQQADTVRKTAHEIENVVTELQAMVRQKDALIAALEAKHGEVGALYAEVQAILPEKERFLDSTKSQLDTVAQERDDAYARIRELEGTVAGLRRDRNRSLDDLRSERDGFKDRSQSLEAEVQRLRDTMAKAEDRYRVAHQRAERSEQDLALSRRERDELTMRLAGSPALEPKRAGLRDARRPGERDSAAAAETHERVAEERRQTIDALRRESVELSHRVIDLEGQVARRDAEVARNRRERERADERLTAVQSELESRTEAERAHRSRWEKAERLLAEKTTSLEVKDQERMNLQRLSGELGSDLERLRAELLTREKAVSESVEERRGLRARLQELESESARLRGELARSVDGHTRATQALEEARLTAEKATSALETVKATREELATRLAETLNARNRSDEERERLVAEARRLGDELKRERDTRQDEHAQMQGKLDARVEELARVENALHDTQQSLGALRDQVPALEQQLQAASSRRDQLEETASRLAEQVAMLQRDLRDMERQRDHNAQELQRLSDEIAATRAQHAGRIRELEQVLAQARAELETSSVERSSLRATFDAQLAEQVGAVGRARAELAHARESGASEIATWKARAQRFEERTEQLLVELQEARDLVAKRQEDVQRLDGQMNNARKRVAQDMRRLSELVAFTEDLKSRLSERDSQVARLEAELATSSAQLARTEARLEQRDSEATASSTALGESQRALAEARTQAKQTGTSAEAVRAKLSSVESTNATLRSGLARLAQEKQDTEARLQEELLRVKGEAKALGKAVSDTHNELGLAREEAKVAMVRERQLRAQLAKREAEAAVPAGDGAPDRPLPDVTKRARELAARVTNLEQEASQHIGETATLKRTIDDLKLRLVRSEQEMRTAHDQVGSGASRLQDLEKQVAESARKVRDLEHALADTQSSLEMRDLMITEADAGVEERDEAIAKLQKELGHWKAQAGAGGGRAQLETALAQRDARIAELERRLATDTRQRPAVQSSPSAAPATNQGQGADRVVSSPPPGAGNASPALGARRDALLKASHKLDRDLLAIKDEMERGASQLAAVEEKLRATGAGTPGRTELERRKDLLEREVHTLQAKLGSGRVQLAAINQEIAAANRHLMTQLSVNPQRQAPGASSS